MCRLFAIVIACFVVFATTGGQRVIAAHLDVAGERVESSSNVSSPKSCCKTYTVQTDHQASACSLPLVMLPVPLEFANRQIAESAWSIRAGPDLDGVLFGPGDQPPKLN